jgi:hypothetical protein
MSLDGCQERAQLAECLQRNEYVPTAEVGVGGLEVQISDKQLPHPRVEIARRSACFVHFQ